MLIEAKIIQRYLRSAGLYSGNIDGIIGPKSMEAIKACLASNGIKAGSWGDKRKINAICQLFLRANGIEVGAIDGLVGPQTRYAVEEWVRLSRDLTLDDSEVAHQPTVWPRQRDVPNFFGNVGSNQVTLELPYPMKIAWDKKKVVTQFSIHAKVADSARRAFQKVHEHYGYNKPPGLDLFGGCLNVRKMRGGSSWSMHAWGIAIDFDPDYNQLYWGRDKARLAKPEYEPFFKIWEAEGWISLGRERNYDWMHLQAARL